MSVVKWRRALATLAKILLQDRYDNVWSLSTPLLAGRLWKKSSMICALVSSIDVSTCLFIKLESVGTSSQRFYRSKFELLFCRWRTVQQPFQARLQLSFWETSLDSSWLFQCWFAFHNCMFCILHNTNFPILLYNGIIIDINSGVHQGGIIPVRFTPILKNIMRKLESDNIEVKIDHQ